MNLLPCSLRRLSLGVVLLGGLVSAATAATPSGDWPSFRGTDRSGTSADTGLLQAWPVLAPHAHALVRSLDVSAALRVPGVVTTLTAADVPGENDSGPSRHDEPVFPVEVMHHKQAIAWVLFLVMRHRRRPQR